jgi:methylthioribose-1-phosphate isomerase
MHYQSPALCSIRWTDEGAVILNQIKLPIETEYLLVSDDKAMYHFIQTLTIRGAGALSIGGAYGVYLGVRNYQGDDNEEFLRLVDEKAAYLASARPTAIKLLVMTEKVRRCAHENGQKPVKEIKKLLLAKCHEIRNENIHACEKIGEYGLTLLKEGMTVLTYCNAGSYATVLRGSALAPFYLAKERGINIKVVACETRPLLQGARLTAHELMQAGVDVTLICDNMAAYCMQQGMIDAVMVSSDTIAANGDTVNKIGTYSLAVMAHYHKIPFYVASTYPSINFSAPTGASVPIEERMPEEITESFGKRTAPYGVKVFNPAFDITPQELITAIICEKGIIYPDFKENLSKIG